MTKDDQEVIMCKDCKYFDKFDRVFPWCKRWNNGSITREDGYCFLAERKDGCGGQTDEGIIPM